MTIKILHLIQGMSFGGAARSMFGLAKYSSRLGDFQHRVAPIIPTSDASVKEMANINGMTIADTHQHSQLIYEMEQADIVLIHWWNNPDLMSLMQTKLPSMRLMSWYHIAGDHPPQMITKEMVNFADFALACNPYSYSLPAFQNLPKKKQEKKAGMIIDGTDFERLEGIRIKPHQHFNVGYIGTVDFVKLNPNFVRMSAAVNLPDVRFVIVGGGNLYNDVLRHQANQLGVLECFDNRGYVQDIRSVLEILDVFGYPLCENTYAAGELTLQEAMFAGIPPVVFPYGGVKSLVLNNKTGMIVNSELEYKQAIEFLYHNPKERARLSQNARQYARKHFGAENTAKLMNPLFEKIMQQPKQLRIWGRVSGTPLHEKLNLTQDLQEERKELIGAALFIESLGESSHNFRTSMMGLNTQEILNAEAALSQSPPVLISAGGGGILHYRNFFPNDGYLQLWSGLIQQHAGKYAEAVTEFSNAIKEGCDHWRVGWYLAQTYEKMGDTVSAINLINKVIEFAPDFNEAQQMKKRLSPHVEQITMPIAQLPKIHNTLAPQAIKPTVKNIINQADALIQQGNLRAAQEILKEGMKDFPGTVELIVQMGNIYIQTGDIEAARREFVKATVLFPKNALGYSMLGLVMIYLQRFEDAEKILRKALVLNPSDANTQNLLDGINQKKQISARPFIPFEQGQSQVSSKQAHRYLVSAIVSAYNSERFLRGRLENLVSQSLNERGQLEIIIIDSNSPQNEKKIVEEYQQINNNIHYIRTEDRETLYGAWNRGIKIAHGEFVINANTDDRFSDDGLELMADELFGCPDIHAVYGDWMVTRQENDTLTSSIPKFKFTYPEFYPPLFLYHQITSHAVMLRRSVFKSIGYYNDHFKVYGDRDFMLRFSVFGFKAKHIPQTVGLFLDTPSSLNRSNSDAVQEYASARMPYTQPETIARLFNNEFTPSDPRQTGQQYAIIGSFGKHYLVWDGQPHNDYQYALYLFKQALKNDHENIIALNNLAVLACASQQHVTGVDLFNHAQNVCPIELRSGILSNLDYARKQITDIERYAWLRPVNPF